MTFGPMELKTCACGGWAYLWPNWSTDAEHRLTLPVRRVCTDCDDPRPQGPELKHMPPGGEA